MKYALALLVALGCILGSAHAQQFPTKSIRFIVPFTPGGGTDTFARIVAPKLGDALGQQVIVDNRAGAQGSIGTAIGAKSPPDGYTIVLGFIGTLTINPHLYRNVGYDPIKDFAAVARGTMQPYVLVVHPSVPVKTLKELAALAGKHPGKLTFGSSSSAAQLAAELFKMITGTNMLHVPYKGAGPALMDLLAGNLDMTFSVPAAPSGHVKAGKLRAIAVTGTKRLLEFPDIPTSAESGYPDLEVTGWYGIVVPAGTPKDIIARLNAETVRALQLSDVKQRLSGAGLDAAPSSSEEFAAIIKKEYERWGKVVKAAGLKVD
ncbi:MAG: tripartite tricarboxylate transporter substrate binding protein [Betaproteobacteria bacterium]|nr:tripartite tricarboxylate transporter substrate binding protein [Betaproteobacteria bacterium]